MKLLWEKLSRVQKIGSIREQFKSEWSGGLEKAAFEYRLEGGKESEPCGYPGKEHLWREEAVQRP